MIIHSLIRVSLIKFENPLFSVGRQNWCCCNNLCEIRFLDMHKKQTLVDAAPGSNNPFRDVGSAGVIGSQRRLDIASQSGRW